MKVVHSFETSGISNIITMLLSATTTKNASPRLRLLLRFGGDSCYHLQHPPELNLVRTHVFYTCEKRKHDQF